MIVKSDLCIQASNALTLYEAIKTATNQSATQVNRVEITVNGTIYLEEVPEIKNNKVPIVIRGTDAVLDAGYRVRNFRPITVNGVEVLCAPIDVAHSESLLYDQLFVNGSRRYRPIFPEDKSGFCGIVREDHGFREMKDEDFRTANSVFRYNGDIPVFSNPEDIELHVCHCWLHERMQVSKIDYKNNHVYTKTTTRYCVMDNDFCALVNVFEMLKKPGQYYCDRKNSVLYYIPMEGETANNIEVVIPSGDGLLKLSNASNISIQGLTFQYVSGRSDYRTRIKQGTPSYVTTRTHRQSECEMGGVISITNSTNCEIVDCIFAHVGVYGIDVIGTADNICVRSCAFHDLGSGAMKTQHDDKRGIRMRGIHFTNNTVKGYGKAYLAACAVLFTYVSESSVDNNEIGDGEYTAISLGWTWDYSNIGYCSNSICGNHLHHIGKKRVDDMGAIYALGVQPFTRIAENRIHDVVSQSGVCFGIYLDEGSSCMTVEKNLIYRIYGDAMHIHYGRDNQVRHNIFADCSRGLLSSSRGEAHAQLYVEQNVFYNLSGHMLRTRNRPGSDSGVRSDKNIYYAGENKPGFSCNSYFPNETYLSLEQWKADTNNDIVSIVGDPMFADAAAGDFRLRSNSPAIRQLGFISPKWIIDDQD